MNADISEFVAEIEEKIDLLVGIDNKVGYEGEYERGYTDAAVAIKNTLNTIAKKYTP